MKKITAMITMFAAFGLCASQDIWESVESKSTKRAKVAAQKQRQDAEQQRLADEQAQQLVAQQRLAAEQAQHLAEEQRFVEERAILRQEHEARTRSLKSKIEWTENKRELEQRKKDEQLWRELESVATKEYAQGDHLVGATVPVCMGVHRDLKKKNKGFQFDRLLSPSCS